MTPMVAARAGRFHQVFQAIEEPEAAVEEAEAEAAEVEDQQGPGVI